MLGRLHHLGVALWPQGQAVGAADPGGEEGLDRFGHVAGVLGHIGSQLDRLRGGGLRDPDDAGGGPAVEYGDIFRLGDTPGGGVQGAEVEVGGTAGEVQQLGPRYGEVGP